MTERRAKIQATKASHRSLAALGRHCGRKLPETAAQAQNERAAEAARQARVVEGTSLASGARARPQGNVALAIQRPRAGGVVPAIPPGSTDPNVLRQLNQAAQERLGR